MAAAAREDPYRDFNFTVSIDGVVEDASFSEVTLPESRIDVIEYREGGDPTATARKLPGRGSVGNLILRRGIDRDRALWEWFRETRDGRLERRFVTVTLLDRDRSAVLRWLVREAWPAAYAFGPLRGLGDEVLVESVELAVEGIDIESI